jgi:hypothetical protein
LAASQLLPGAMSISITSLILRASSLCTPILFRNFRYHSFGFIFYGRIIWWVLCLNTTHQPCKS